MAKWVSLPDLAVDDESEQGEFPLLYSERRALPQHLHAENQVKLQIVGGNLNLAVAETTLRATTREDEVDKSLRDLATVVTVGCRLRTLRKVVYVPAAPNEGTIELSAELAVGLRTKAISDQFAERFAELSLDGLGPGVAPANLNRGSGAAMIGQFVNAMDLRHCQGAACSYIWTRAWANYSVLAMAMTGELDAVWSAAPGDMIFEARSAGAGAAVVNHAADLFSGRGFVVELSANEMDQYAPALRCLLSPGPIVVPRFDTTALRDDGNVFDTLQGVRCPQVDGRPTAAELALGPVAGGDIHMLSSAFRFTDPITVWAINTGPELRNPAPGGAPQGSLGDFDLQNAGAPILGNPPGADFNPVVAAVNKLRPQDLESAMRLLVRAFPSPLAVEAGWMLAMNRMASPMWVGATDGDNVGTTASGQLGSIAVPHSGALISAHVIFGGFVQYQAKAADRLSFALKYFRGRSLAQILLGGWLWARVIGTALSQALRYVAIPPAALTEGPWLQAWDDPRSALVQYLKTRDGEPTVLTAAIVRAFRRCFGVEIATQLEVCFQAQNSLVQRPGLRFREYGRTRLDVFGKYDAIDMYSAQQFYPSTRTSVSEPGFSQTPRQALEETVKCLGVQSDHGITLDATYMSKWTDGALDLREPVGMGGGPGQLLLTPIANAVLQGGTLSVHELEVRRGSSTASDRLAAGAGYDLPDLSYFASYRNLRVRPNNYRAIRKVFTAVNRILYPARELKWSLRPDINSLRRMLINRESKRPLLGCTVLTSEVLVRPAFLAAPDETIGTVRVKRREPAPLAEDGKLAARRKIDQLGIDPATPLDNVPEKGAEDSGAAGKPEGNPDDLLDVKQGAAQRNSAGKAGAEGDVAQRADVREQAELDPRAAKGH